MVCDLIQQILNPFKNLDRLRYRAVLLTEFLLPLEVYKGPYMPLSPSKGHSPAGCGGPGFKSHFFHDFHAFFQPRTQYQVAFKAPEWASSTTQQLVWNVIPYLTQLWNQIPAMLC